MYRVRLEWPAESTNRSRPGQCGSAGLCRITFWNRRYAAGARLIAVPGWPLPTFWTASMANTRTVSTALSSSSVQSRSDREWDGVVGTSVVSSHRLLTTTSRLVRGPGAGHVRLVRSPGTGGDRLTRVCTPDPLRQPAHSDDPPPLPGPEGEALRDSPRVRGVPHRTFLGSGDSARRRRRLRRAHQAP